MAEDKDKLTPGAKRELQKLRDRAAAQKAFAKEQVEKGKELPFDLFGVYIANKAKLKTKE